MTWIKRIRRQIHYVIVIQFLYENRFTMRKPVYGQYVHLLNFSQWWILEIMIID